MDDDANRLLIDRARAGDADAFASLFSAFRRDVTRLCARLLGSRDEAEDAASEVFLRAHRGFDSYDAGRPFRRWLLAVAAHHAIERLRRRATERRIFDPASIDDVAIVGAGPSPLQGALASERRRELLAAIDTLPDRYRAPLVLRYYADFDYDAIAEATGTTRNQVATLLFRGKRRLRELLATDEQALGARGEM